MANVAHATLTGDNLHEPKGIEDATSNQVYLSDGLGSGDWVDLQDIITADTWSTGDVKLTIKTIADIGWVLMDDGSIGSATSGATTRANADTQDLFMLIWNSMTNANAPVSGGRGASAIADWTANKTITLPKTLGRALAVYGLGSGLTSRALGLATGDETIAISEAQLPNHTHALSGSTSTAADHTHGLSGSGTTDAVAAHTHSFTSNAAGSHNHSFSTDQAGNHTHVATVNDPGHQHNTQYTPFPLDAGAGAVNSVGGGSQDLTSSNTTGISVSLSTTGSHGHTGSTATVSDHTHSGTTQSSGGHSHGLTLSGSVAAGGSHSHTLTGSIGATGSGNGHANLQPSVFLNVMIKL